jgi:hypothetical protein
MTAKVVCGKQVIYNYTCMYVVLTAHVGLMSSLGNPPCADRHCISCVLDSSKCDPVGCADGFVFNEETFGCDGT